MQVLPLRSDDTPDWLEMCSELWSDATQSEHQVETAALLAEPRKFAQFIARSEGGNALGFIEGSIRTEYVNGTETSHVAFLEGLFVRSSARRQGVARKLVNAVVQWAMSQGSSELASDAPIKNRRSHAVHKRLGFTETERVVYFNMPLK